MKDDVFTPKMISPNCPFKNNQRLTKISILILRCAVPLRCLMQTAELDSTVDAHCTVELDSVVGCTPLSLTPGTRDAHHLA